MNNTSIYTSLDDTSNLRKLILENPELPLMVFVGEFAHTGEWGYNSADASSGSIQELVVKSDEYVEKDEYIDRLNDEIENEEELKKAIEEMEVCKAIVIYVG